jgi:hypothetical protein
MAGLGCHRKLWQLLWDRGSAAPDDGMSQLIMEYGTRFGELAHSLFPDGTLIDIDISNLDKAVEDTRQAIKSGTEVIMEATFCHGQCRILADIVERQQDGSWHLIEVKSSTHVKNEHIPDLAYQKWVMEQCGYPVSRCSVIHADKSGVWPDVNSIFNRIDVTAEVDAASSAVSDNVERMLALTNPGCAAPDAREHFAKRCKDCNFKKTVCWKDIDGFTIYDAIHATKIPTLEAMNILYLRDIPNDFNLNDRDRRNVTRINHEAIDIDNSAIAEMLDKLEHPIYFLDFESVSVAVPLFDGNSPWEKLAFQYSLHIMDKDGEVRHVEYLHEEATDPSAEVARRLVQDIGEHGSIVVYYAGMESGILKYLRDRFPDHSAPLQGMIDRLWDLELLFKNHYRHWKFGSKSTIKVVLPTLIPELSYDDLDIHEGGGASWSWIQMIESDDAETRQAMAEALREYCKRDTWAMVKLLELLWPLRVSR